MQSRRKTGNRLCPVLTVGTMYGGGARPQGNNPVDPATNSLTSTTLLVGLRHSPADEDSWGAFVARNGRRINNWCHHQSVQDDDAQDVTQAGQLRLLQAVRPLRYNPSLKCRARLETVTHHAWQDLVPETAGGPGLLPGRGADVTNAGPPSGPPTPVKSAAPGIAASGLWPWGSSATRARP
jgi:hypothetical protein